MEELIALSRLPAGWKTADFLGEGTFGGVYLLEKSGERRAVKVMRVTEDMADHFAAKLSALERLRSERHAVNIYGWETVNIRDGGQTESYLVILMEKLSKLPKKMPEDEVIRMGIQLCSLPGKCHSGAPKLYHRDHMP